MEIWYGIIGIAIGLLAGIMVGIIIRKNVSEKTIGSAEQHAKNIVLDAEHQAETIKKEKKLEAQEEALKMKNEIEKEIKQRRNEISKSENRLIQKEETIDKKLEQIERKEQSITDKEEGLNKRKKEVEEIHKRQLEELEKISGYTRDEAKQILLDSIENDVKVEASTIIKEVETRTKEEADKRAKNIIVNAIQRCAADHVAESTVSGVSLPNEEMKGRIIGREGRNIRAIEAATGVDLIIDDTPEAVVLSSFDGVRREVARIALEKLISDGRIHPTKIEEVVAKAQEEVEESVLDAAEQAILEVGIPTLPREVLKVFGRLKFRTSFGQNILQHSREVAHIAAALAAEIGANVDVAKRAGLLHDIGKAFSHEQEGSHAINGGEFLRKFSKENEIVINAVESHHNEVEQLSVEAVLVQAADSISASRPGARRETLSNYLKRLEQLEEIANSHEGIESSYAIQAGRELRLIVHPDNIDDDRATILAREVAKEIEEKMQYPGQIKVTVIRETRAVEYAK